MEYDELKANMTEALKQALKPLKGRTIDAESKQLAKEIVSEVLDKFWPQTPRAKAIRLISDIMRAMFDGAPGVIVQRIKKADDEVLACLMELGAAGFGGLGQLVAAETALRAGQLVSWDAVQEGPGDMRLILVPKKDVEWIEVEFELANKGGKGADQRRENS